MWKVRFIVVLLICVSPVVLFWDGLIAQGLVAAVVAIGLVITARTLRSGEAEFLISIVLPAAAVAAVPALWILLQALPFGLLANPIWASAKLALGHSTASAISIDPGTSVIALGQYLSLGAVAFLSAAVAVDRVRAEWLLFAMTGTCVVFALILIAHGFLSPILEFSAFTHSQGADCAAMGAVIASAACMRLLERYENRRRLSHESVPALLWTLGVCGAALVLCVAAVALEETLGVLFATTCGIVIVAWVMVVRRFRLGAWGVVPFAVVVMGVALLVFTTHSIERRQSVLFNFASSSSTGGVSERMLKDAPLVGAGAGTFTALVPIYRAIDDPPNSAEVLTTAATLAIELGPPMLWFIVLAMAALVLILLRAALRRGRDSYYPAMGGGCLVTLLLLIFMNAGLLGIAAGLIVAGMCGLSIAQSQSRTA